MNLIVILSLIIITNFTWANQPKWISGQVKKYPQDKYLTAVGSGDNQQKAHDRAIQNLATIFEVKIIASSSIKENIKESKGTKNKDNSFNKKTYVQNSIKTFTNQLIEGIKVTDYYHNKKTTDYFALAVLDKAKAAQTLYKQIEKIENQIIELMQTNSHNSNLLKLQILNKTYKLVQQKEELNKKYHVLGRSPIIGKYDKYPFQKNIIELRNQTIISLETESNNSSAISKKQLSTIIENNLTNIGFTISKNAKYKLKISLNISEISKKGGWYWQYAFINLKMYNNKGDNIGSKTLETRASTTSINLINYRLKEKINSILKQKMANLILEIF